MGGVDYIRKGEHQAALDRIRELEAELAQHRRLLVNMEMFYPMGVNPDMDKLIITARAMIQAAQKEKADEDRSHRG